MSFKTVEVTLASDVAVAGTFTVPYPSGRDAGHYLNTVGHTIVSGSNDVYNFKEHFTLTFGTSSITVTTVTPTTFLAGTNLVVQLEEQGRNDTSFAPDVSEVVGGAMAYPILVHLGAPDVADADGHCASQSIATTANGLLNGALAGTNDVPRNIVGAWTTASIITVTGTDVDDNVLVEKCASGTTFTGKKAFKTVTSINSSESITSATFGTGDVLGLPVFVPAKANVLAVLKDGVIQSGFRDKVLVQGIMTEANVDAATSLFLVAPCAGVITKVWTMCQGTVTTGGTFTAKVNTVAVNGLSVVVANSAAAGDMDSDTPTNGHASCVVAAGDNIEIVGDAAFNASADFVVVVEIEPTHTIPGTWVYGDVSYPTATTGDVRGTFDPTEACDGSLAFSMLLALPDPTYKGMEQYAG